MLSEKELEAALLRIESRIDAVNTFYLKKVGEQINEIGKLSPTSVHKLIQIRKAGTNIEKINAELQKATEKNLVEINKLYKQALKETYTDQELTALSKGVALEPLAQNKQMQSTLEALSRVTTQSMRNFANTTNVSAMYKEVVSDAVQASLSGVGDYNSAMRRGLEQAATEGLKVTYESGYTRRLDSAIRMNVIDGVKHVQQEVQRIIGEEIGADGVELTAHPNSATDHEPCQGRQYTKAEFEKMQSGSDFYDVDGNHYEGFHRPIGEWNCTHFAFSVVLGVSKRRYSDQQLEEWRKSNNEGCKIDGMHYTKYEAAQLMRQMETKIRQQKDVANAAKASGDDVLRRKAQKNITQITAKYKEVADKSGLETRFERTFVSGFKDVKLPSLTNAAGQGIIEVTKTLLNSDPDLIAQVTLAKGGIDRNYYGDDTFQVKQISNHDHGNPKEHPFGKHGEHAHDYIWQDGKLVDRPMRELTEEERKENADIL